MKKAFSLLLALSLVLTCAFALAEESETCTYTVFNETGEMITELYVTDNLTGEKSENYAGEEGLKKGGIVEINGINKEGYVITLSFKTESGYEAAFETLHCETVPISLLPAPAEPADADAVPDDGLIDVTVVGKLSKWKFLLKVPSLFKGDIFKQKEVTHTRGRQVEISAAPYSYMEVDGEPVGITPVRIEVIPAGVQVVSNL